MLIKKKKRSLETVKGLSDFSCKQRFCWTNQRQTRVCSTHGLHWLEKVRCWWLHSLIECCCDKKKPQNQKLKTSRNRVWFFGWNFSPFYTTYFNSWTMCTHFWLDGIERHAALLTNRLWLFWLLPDWPLPGWITDLGPIGRLQDNKRPLIVINTPPSTPEVLTSKAAPAIQPNYAPPRLPLIASYCVSALQRLLISTPSFPSPLLSYRNM